MNIFIPFRKNPYFQPAEDMCVSSAIKTVIDNQFTKSFSLRQINKLCKYEWKKAWGLAIEDLEVNLEKPLAQLGIQYNFKENLKIDDLFDLLNVNIYPIIFFPLSKYNEWADEKDLREVSGDNEPNLHTLIIVGINKENQKIKLFDTIYNKFRSYSDLNNLYKEITFGKFLQCWENRRLIYPCIWLSEKQKIKKSDKQNNTLEKYGK